jgi:methyltransferase (TIGR00027 family)
MAEEPKGMRNISDTARWVAVYRAMETERPDAIFQDPFARKLAGERGDEIVKSIPRGTQGAWAMIVRTHSFDELIQREIRERSIDTVLNLAAGLDSRPYRLPLTASLRWIDVDLPEMTAYKEEALKGETPRCRLERVVIDLTDSGARQKFFAEVNDASQRVLVITEGLLVYLKREQVIALANDLHAQPRFGSWLIDLAGPGVLEWIKKKWAKSLEAANAPMHFAPEESTEFFRPLGWEPIDFRDFGEEGRRLKRTPPMAWLFRLMAMLSPKKAERMKKKWRSGVALLRRT